MLNKSEMGLLDSWLPFMKELTPQQRQILQQGGYSRKYPQGESLRTEQGNCSGPVIVQSGQLRAYLETPEGKSVTLYRLLPGDSCILTASCVMRNITFDITLETEKSSEVLFLSPTVWSKLLQQNSHVRDFSMELVSGRFSEAMWVMEQMVSKSMGQRVASFLLEQHVLEDSFNLRLTHDTIAGNLGTAREVVSRILKYMAGEQILAYTRGQIQILDMEKLRQMGR